ncbi:hypothetical protein [Leifsonia sp. 71-9]|uniref:hypothetical protein n=1 Tax=Leifsonia sp. 71-9 TaxID=1895934 RepID=UPI0025C49ABF|nr:hypothetical protein [Leifsonia sp. 71-9]
MLSKQATNRIVELWTLGIGAVVALVCLLVSIANISLLEANAWWAILASAALTLFCLGMLAYRLLGRRPEGR